MTGQIHDTVEFQGTTYDVVGANTPTLFHPRMVGIEPFKLHTACYRGFIAHYTVDDGLVLERLEVRVEGDEYPPIEGVEPRIAEHAIYEGLSLCIPFDGILRIGGGMIQSLYVHLGFQPPMAYKQVLQLLIREGTYVTFADHSKHYRKERRTYRKLIRTSMFPPQYEDGFELERVYEALAIP